MFATCLAALCLVAGIEQPRLATGTERAECLTPRSPAACAFKALDAEFSLSSTGQFERRGASGPVTATRIAGIQNDELARVFVAPVASDLLVFDELDGGESGGGCAFRIDPQRLAVKWHVKLRSFNLSAGAIEGKRLYQAGMGFVSAIDLGTGQFAWTHSDLYDRTRFAFNSFERPQVLEREVRFTEHVDGGSPRIAEAIRVDKATGRILK